MINPFVDGRLFGDLAKPLVVDLFSGGGGASLGLEWAGSPVDVAVNHSAAALAMHKANHPDALHLEEDVFDVPPALAARGRRVDTLWASPQCTHHSRALGGVPRSEQLRSQADVVVNWARDVKPRAIYVENVPEFLSWGRLLDGRPDPVDKGNLYRRWVGQLEGEGYEVESRVLKACDYGVPTRRERVYVVARRDAAPCWPVPTHGPGLEPFATAASCIDWSLPCPSIFLSPEEARAQGCRRPLRPATLRRIAEGVRRFVIEAQRPFLVTLDGGQPAAVAPWLISTANGEREGQAPRVRSIQDPLVTATATGSQGGLVAAFLAEHFGGGDAGVLSVGRSMEGPMGSPTASAQMGPVAVFLDRFYGSARVGASVEGPMGTATTGGGRGGGHEALVAAFLMHYYTGGGQGQSATDPLATSTTKARSGLVTVTISGRTYVIRDIGMRMLTPREVAAGMGFPKSYKLIGSKSQQFERIGNAVCPWMAYLIASANRSTVGRMAA